jgi:CDP-diacylglycerol--glycerol-3-phosphate 3-phosphatidyltransferase
MLLILIEEENFNMLKFIPNLLSISRIFMMFPLILYLEKIETGIIYVIYSIVIITMIVLSDILDGFVARKLNSVSSFGKILDPVSDKICLMVVLIFLINKYNFIFFIFFILLSARDIILVSLTSYLAIRYNFISQANKLGKYFMLSTVMMIIFFLFNLNSFLSILIYIITIIMLIISTVNYMKEHLNRIKKYENI